GGGGGGGRGGSSSHSSHGISSSSPYGNMIDFLILGSFIGINFLFVKNGSVSRYKVYSKKREAMSTLKDFEIENPAWNFYEIETQIEESFPLIQEAWMNRDYSPVKHLMTDNFFDTHTVKMNWMLLKKEKNILSDVELKRVTPILAVENDENGEDFIWVLLKAKMIDYTINEENNCIIDGDYSTANSFEEFWKFIRKEDKWLADTILQVDDIESLDYFDKLKP
ncbi:Tim44 domain-containing protein, partial [Clostridium perfringens]